MTLITTTRKSNNMGKTTITIALAALLLTTAAHAGGARYSAECDQCSIQGSKSRNVANGDLYDHYFGSGSDERRKSAKERLFAPARYELARQRAMGSAMTSIGWRSVSPGGFTSPDFSCSDGC